MNGQLHKHASAAARAGWWTLLLMWALTAAGGVWMLVILRIRPAWLADLYGEALSWDDIRTVGLWTIAAFKVVFWTLLTVVIWLSLWARRLGRAD